MSLIGPLALPVHAEDAAALDLCGKGLCSDEAAFAGAQSKLKLQYNSTNETTKAVSLSLDMALDSPYLNGVFAAAADDAALGITPPDTDAPGYPQTYLDYLTGLTGDAATSMPDVSVTLKFDAANLQADSIPAGHRQRPGHHGAAVHKIGRNGDQKQPHRLPKRPVPGGGHLRRAEQQRADQEHRVYPYPHRP